MTTSTCGPDIEAALGSFAKVDYERFRQKLASDQEEEVRLKPASDYCF